MKIHFTCGCHEAPFTYKTVVLKPNWVNGKNVLTQAMLSDTNTKYVIKWNYDLNGETIYVPGGCILEFDGGIVRNGTMVGLNTFVNNVGDVNLIFDNVIKEGTWRKNEIQDISELVSLAEYSREDKKIYFKNVNDEILCWIDATDFIKDGMVDAVVVRDGNLVVTFNTDAGKEDISIPLTDIFDADAYYTKEETDSLLEDKADSDSVYTKDNTYNKNEINTLLDAKAGVEDSYTKEESNNRYQEKLVSGVNIKTINEQSLLGSGNITVEGGGEEQDKDYDPENFSGLGRVYLKQNIVEEGGVKQNRLVQDAFYKDDGEGNRVPNTNTVFVVAYAFDLNGQTVNIPEECVLEFDGGSIAGGILYSNGTVLSGDYKNSSDYLYGAFYNEGGELLNHNKDAWGEFYYEAEYGEGFHNFNEQFHLTYADRIRGVQGIAVTRNHVFLFCITSSSDVEASYPKCLCYDRYYNLLGWCVVENYSHFNDCTVAGDTIYIPDYHHGKINYTTENALVEACLNNGSITFSEFLESNIGAQLDYDEYSQTFCMVSDTGIVNILDAEFNIIKHGNSSVFSAIRNHIGEGVTTQGSVYRKGLLYLNIGVDDQQVATMVVYDVATDSIVKCMRLPFPSEYIEGEGMCVDPVSGDIIMACNAWHTDFTHFEIARLKFSEVEFALSNDRRSGVGYSDLVHNVSVYVNNNMSDKNYKPTGTEDKPYRSIFEALICRRSFGRYFQLNVVNTGIDYYLIGFTTTSATTLRITGISGKPKIVTYLYLFNMSYLQIYSAKIQGVGSADLGVNCAITVGGQNASLRCESVEFLMTENAKYGIYANSNYIVYATVNFIGCTFTGYDTSVDPVYPGFQCECVGISWGGFGNILFSSIAPTFNYCVGIDITTNHLPNIDFTTSTIVVNMAFNHAAFLRHLNHSTSYGNIFIGDAFNDTRYKQYKNFLQYCSNYTCSIKNNGPRKKEDGTIVGKGLCVGANLDFELMNSEEFKYQSNGVNLIKTSSNLAIREVDAADVWNSWRKVSSSQNTGTFPYPNIVNADFDYIEEVEKAFQFSASPSLDYCIAYNIRLQAGTTYSFSFWAKGSGTVRMYVDAINTSGLVSTCVVNNVDYEYYYTTFTLSDALDVSHLGSFYLVVAKSDESLTMCAPKLEIGQKPTLWSNETPSGSTSQRTTHPNIGERFYDTTLNKSVTWNGNDWVDEINQDVALTATSTFNFNNETTTGRKFFSNSAGFAGGAPSDLVAGSYSMLETYTISGWYKVQRFTVFSGSIYLRFYYNNVWQPWVKVGVTEQTSNNG